MSPASALSELFARYHVRVHIWCVRVLGDSAAADDATQEIFLALLQRSQAYEPRTSFRAWLYVVTRNHCLNTMRGRRREIEIDGEQWLHDQLVARDDPTADLAMAQTAHIVQEVCLEVLTPVEQQVVYLRYYWRLRVKEITARLALENVSGARSKLATATRKIRRGLLERLGEQAARDLFREGQ